MLDLHCIIIADGGGLTREAVGSVWSMHYGCVWVTYMNAVQMFSNVMAVEWIALLQSEWITLLYCMPMG